MLRRMLVLWVAAGVAFWLFRQRVRDRLHGEAGEGVISMAIAVLIIAALGALIWVGFQALWVNAEQQIQGEVNKIGGGGT